MADPVAPITFAPYLDWVDVPNPNEPPANARFLTAADLKRYENFGKDATALLTAHNSRLAGLDTLVAGEASKLSTVTTNLGTVTTKINNATTGLDSKAPKASPTFTGTVSGISAAMVGLGSVNNTADANKPVSTPQKTYIDAVGTRVTAVEKAAGRSSYAKSTATVSVWGDPVILADKASHAFVAGRSYLITIIGSVHADAVDMAGQVEIYTAPTGSSGMASTTRVSTNTGGTIWTPARTMSGSAQLVMGVYTPAASASLRVYTTLQRVVGTGTIFANTPWGLLIQDLGELV